MPQRVRLTGAINETLSFSFAIRANESSIPRPDLRAAALTAAQGKIDASAITLYRLHPVEAGRFPGWHIRSIAPRLRDHRPWDVLVPIRASRGGLPAELTASETYAFWADVTVPKGTFAGVYATTIEVLSGGSPFAALDIELTVRPIVLPDESNVPLIADIDHQALFQHHLRFDASTPAFRAEDWGDHPRKNEMDALLMSTLRMLQGHRISPVLPGLAPTARINAAGGLGIDWEHYDSVVEPLLSGRAFFNRVPLRLWPLPAAMAHSGSSASIGNVSAAMTAQYVTQSALHFDQKGWLERCYVIAPSSAPQQVRQFSHSVRQADSRIAVASRAFPQDMSPYGWPDFPHGDFSDAVDIWMPPAQFYDFQIMTEERRKGRRTWMTADRPPFSGSTMIHASSVNTRVLPWQADGLGAQAISIGSVNAWPATSGPSPDDCVRVDPHVLLYPGRAFGLDEPVPSVRLKNLRQGAQDAAYFRLLREHGLEHVVIALRDSLSIYAASDAFRTHFADGRPAGWAEDAQLYDAAREIMADELVRAASPNPAPDSAPSFERTAAWRRFMLATRKLEVRAEGVRARFAGTPTARRVELETGVSIVNRKRSAQSGEIRFGPLPDPWTATTEGEPVSAIAPRNAARATLTAYISQIPICESGVWELPIELSTDDGELLQRTARLAAITAIPTDSPIRVDGDLSDWPPGGANVAADFRLISSSESDLPGNPLSRPSRRTFGFVMRDQENLFVAINCEHDGRREGPTARRKGVQYDDMIPVSDEDLVELLLDPLNGGTRSPGDLYHIVVKRSGADLTEKGIGFDPPCGARAPWSVDWEVATAESSRNWTVEMRLPLKAISPDGHNQTVWGFSVTRWDASRQEFSTWSGAAGNAYDPLSLGNLFLP